MFGLVGTHHTAFVGIQHDVKDGRVNVSGKSKPICCPDDVAINSLRERSQSKDALARGRVYT